ncbi:MAG: ABC transporter permease [Candidatus Bathyarchaeota archaeon]|nr:ABC transporter permease [Candidatus Bathyarchaeota archaeon]
MNRRNVWLVFKKDWLEIKRNPQVLLPIVIVPIIFAVVLPAIVVLISSTPAAAGSSQNSVEGFLPLIANLPQDIQAMLAQMEPNQVMVYIMAVYFFAPFFLIIPIMASSVMGSDSFAGEKERKTIEALLATPLTDGELLLGKSLVSFIPAMAVTFVSFFVYGAIIDVATYSMFNGMLLIPNAVWLILIFGVTPALALCSIGLTVIISARVKGFKEAQQISVVLLLPILGLLFAQVSGLLILGPVVLAALIGLLVLVDIAIFYLGMKVFQREEILSRQS